MTLEQLIDETQLLVGADIPPSELIPLLNRAMVRTARTLEIPRIHLDIENVVGEFTINTDTYGVDADEVVEVRQDDSAGTLIPILTARTANTLHPGWRSFEDGTPQFMVHDRGVIGLGRATLFPVPTPSTPMSYVVEVIARPTEMEEMSDVPFDGLIPEYHEMLAYYVAFQLLLRTGDQRAGTIFEFYRRLLDDAWSSLRPRAVSANSAGAWWKVDYA